MKYLSLFSGIGGFEIAIKNIFPNSKCIGYSEINKSAIKAYEYHFPNHYNLGDITLITKKDIENLLKNSKCDLIVAGFPCQNLSSISTLYGKNSNGLQGPKSKLFFNMINIIQWIIEFNKKIPYIIIENNNSMKSINKQIITQYLKDIDNNIEPITINSNLIGVQTRNRIYWNNIVKNQDEFISKLKRIKLQDWNTILLPINYNFTFFSTNRISSFNKISKPSNLLKNTKICKLTENNNYTFELIKDYGFSKWHRNHYSVSFEKSCPILRSNNFIIDTRFGNNAEFRVRYLEPIEAERLFFLPDGWITNLFKKTKTFELLGNTIVFKIIEEILKEI